jgi:cephalosporin hydroxylase
MSDFMKELADRIAAAPSNGPLQEATRSFLLRSVDAKYSYNFSWFSRPIIQYPQDIVAMQELIWSVRPDLIIETGIAHGGSLILSASLVALLDLCDATVAGETLDPRKPRRRVLGVDVDIRAHNRTAIEAHPLAARIDMIQGSSIAADVIARVKDIAAGYKRVLVCLDSNHTHEHVLAELTAYAPLTTQDSYCVVFDTVIEDLPSSTFPDRPWGPGNNPKTAVHEFLKTHPEFVIDKSIEQQLLVTVAPDGWLKRIA